MKKLPEKYGPDNVAILHNNDDDDEDVDDDDTDGERLLLSFLDSKGLRTKMKLSAIHKGLSKSRRGGVSKATSELVGKFYRELLPISHLTRGDIAKQISSLVDRDKRRLQQQQQQQKGNGATPCVTLFENFKWYRV